MRQALVIVGVVILAGVVIDAQSNGQANRFSTRLESYQEVPAVSSPGVGTFSAHIDDSAQAIDWELEFEGLDGDITMSHIHFGQPGVSGGIMIWLCKTTQTAPAGTATCPAGKAGRLSGTIGAADVAGPTSQLVTAGQFDEAVAAIHAGIAYVNVHTTLVGSGEIRGQLRAGDGHK